MVGVDDKIAVTEGAGKNLRCYKVTVAGVDVEQEVIVVCDKDGNPVDMTTTTICDGTTPTQKVAVDANGKIGVSSLPNVTIASMPGVTISSMPSITIGADSVGLAKESGGNLASILTQLDVKLSTRFKSGDSIGNTGFSASQSGSWAVYAYGSQSTSLVQRGTTYDLLVQLRTAGTEYDARSIRALTSSDVVTVQQTTRTSLTVMPEREDLATQAAIISPNGAGVVLVSGVAGKKVKVYKWGYHSTVDGNHFFYFGTSTTAPTLSATPTSKVFGISILKGHYRQTNIHPDEGASGDGLYLYSANAESSMSVDYQMVQE